MRYGDTVRKTVQAMLEKGMVDEVLAFVRGVDERDVVPAFITDAAEAEKITVASYQPYSLASILADYGDKGKKIGLVVRSCDARGVIELAKRNQVNRDDIYLIGIECYGTVNPANAKEGEIYIFHDAMEVGGKKEALDESLLSANCRRCEYPVPGMADISCAIDGDGAIANTPKGEEMLAAANLKSQGSTVDASAMKERAARWQDKDFPNLGTDRQERLDYWLRQFDKCIKCYGCRNVCPLCYCKDCALDADRVWVERGRMPPPRLFHLTRLMHIADSCLNCGQCEAVCPMEIPLTRLYHQLHNELRSIFDYESGINIDDALPLGTFTEDELKAGGVELG
jgi:formate dehydrogenase subunit beta